MSKVNGAFAKNMKVVNRQGDGVPIKIHKSFQDAIDSTTKDLGSLHKETTAKIKEGIDKERRRFLRKR